MANILMIEDDLDFAEIMMECLREDPLCKRVDLVTNEADARFQMENNQLGRFDAILVDLHLRRSDYDAQINPEAGLELIADMRKGGFRGRIIVVTNSSSLIDGQRAWSAGCDGYLCKHVRSGDLASLLQELRMAIRGDVVLVSQEMRYIFMRPFEHSFELVDQTTV